jgi:hypothetical protein
MLSTSRKRSSESRLQAAGLAAECFRLKPLLRAKQFLKAIATWMAGTDRALRSRQSNPINSGEIAMKLSRRMTKTMALLLALTLTLNVGSA